MQLPYAFSYAALAVEGSLDVHLIDAGLDTDENWEALGVTLRGLGQKITDIASVAITHLPQDHTGLAWRVQGPPGRSCVCTRRTPRPFEDESTFWHDCPDREGVTEWAVGDEICALLAGGGYSERVAVPAT